MPFKLNINIEQLWSWAPAILQICLLAFLIYSILYFLRGTRASNILTGLAIGLIGITVLTDYLNLSVFSWLLDNFWRAIATVLIVIFQPELRRAFAQLGRRRFSNRNIRKKEAINEVVNAVVNMSKKRIGALIVFERQIGMASIIENAAQLDIRLNTLIIESIFYPNSTLHDGAIVVRDNRIVAAHVILPLTQDESQHSLGTRHRAALGVTEETDAVALIVSEETGAISIACQGRLKKGIKGDKVLRYLTALLITKLKQNLKDIFEKMDAMVQLGVGFTGGALKDD
jgi:diadenylate cyclase